MVVLLVRVLCCWCWVLVCVAGPLLECCRYRNIRAMEMNCASVHRSTSFGIHSGGLSHCPHGMYVSTTLGNTVSIPVKIMIQYSPASYHPQSDSMQRIHVSRPSIFSGQHRTSTPEYESTSAAELLGDGHNMFDRGIRSRDPRGHMNHLASTALTSRAQRPRASPADRKIAR